MKDLIENLLDLRNYEGCRITQDGTDTIQVHGIKGTDLKLTFKKKIQNWEVKLRVTGNFEGKPEPNHLMLCSDMEVTDEVRSFWNELSQSIYENDSKGIEDRTKEAMMILDAEVPKKSARRKPPFV